MRIVIAILLVAALVLGVAIYRLENKEVTPTEASEQKEESAQPPAVKPTVPEVVNPPPPERIDEVLVPRWGHVIKR